MPDVTPADIRRAPQAPRPPPIPLLPKSPEAVSDVLAVRKEATPEDIAAGAVTLQLTTELWTRMLSLIQDGLSTKEVVRVCGVSPTHLEWLLRTKPDRYKEWREARVLAVRRNWDLQTIEDICRDIGEGQSLKTACESRGRDQMGFISLAMQDETVKEMYEFARKVRSELLADEIVEIADDESNDLDIQGKGNGAAVKRSELRINTRMELMGAYNSSRFRKGKGPQTDVNVNVTVNHAERLEAARQRARRAPETIDAEVVK